MEARRFPMASRSRSRRRSRRAPPEQTANPSLEPRADGEAHAQAAADGDSLFDDPVQGAPAQEPAPGGPAPTSDWTARTTRTIVVLAVTEIAGKLSMLVIIVGAARLLGVADFGVFAYALAVGLLAAVIPLWGYDIVVVQRGSAEPGRLRGLLADLLVTRTALVFVVLAVLAASAGSLGLSGPPDSRAGLAAFIIAAAAVLDTYTEAYRSAAAAIQRQSIIAVVHLVQRLLTAAAALTALLLHTGLLGLAVAYLAGTLVGPLAGALLVRHQGIGPRWREVSVASLVRLNRGTWVLGVASILAMALFRLDILLIAWLVGDRAVGVYAAAYRLLETALFVCFAVARTVFPLMAADAEPRRVQRHLERGWSVLAAIFLPYMTLLCFRGHDLLLLFYGEPFAGAGTDILRWLAAAPLLFSLSYVISMAMVAAGPTPRLLIASAVALVVNVSLNLLLIPRYGAIAAAFTTPVTYLAEAVAGLWLGRRRMGRPRLVWTLLPALVASGVAAGPLLAPLPLAPALLAAAAVYLPSLLLVARFVDPEQIQVLRHTLTPWRTG
ncbi:flippase [Streptomyces sp. NPDC000070]|uniref:flippase n=1 Tax=Streptomyces sp. NPDC000070 TaxID=3154240 RepID=UPI00332D0D61